MVVCKFFMSGYCRYGDRCRFEHPGQFGFASQQSKRGFVSDGGFYHQEPDFQDPYGQEYDDYEEPIQYPAVKAAGWQSPLHRSGSPSKSFQPSMPQDVRASNDVRYSGSSEPVPAAARGGGFAEKFHSPMRKDDKHWVSPAYAEKLRKREEENMAEAALAKFSFKGPTPELRFSRTLREELVRRRSEEERPEASGAEQAASSSVSSAGKRKGKKKSYGTVDYELIGNDFDSWKEGNGYLFSSYGLGHRKSLFGLPDISPEELHLEFRESQMDGTFDLYKGRVEALARAYSDTRKKALRHLEDPNSQWLETLSFRTQLSSLPSSFLTPTLCALFGLPPPPDSNLMPPATIKEAIAVLETQKKMGQSSRFEDVGEVVSPVPFSFHSPQHAQAVAETAARMKRLPKFLLKDRKKGLDTYSRALDLTESEKKAFADAEFTIGSIPLKPPPESSCH